MVLLLFWISDNHSPTITMQINAVNGPLVYFLLKGVAETDAYLGR